MICPHCHKEILVNEVSVPSIWIDPVYLPYDTTTSGTDLGRYSIMVYEPDGKIRMIDERGGSI
jgi:hypothetical protein